MDEHCWIDTPLGTMYLAIRDGALHEAGFVDTVALPLHPGAQPDPPDRPGATALASAR